VRWAGYVARIEESRGLYRVLVGNPKGRRPLGRPRCRWEHKIKLKFQEVRLEAWIGLMWLRRRTCRGHLQIWYCTFGFHKIRGIFRVVVNRLASQEELSSMK
jgi:hypothetical protein